MSSGGTLWNNIVVFKLLEWSIITFSEDGSILVGDVRLLQSPVCLPTMRKTDRFFSARTHAFSKLRNRVFGAHGLTSGVPKRQTK